LPANGVPDDLEGRRSFKKTEKKKSIFIASGGVQAVGSRLKSEDAC